MNLVPERDQKRKMKREVKKREKRKKEREGVKKNLSLFVNAVLITFLVWRKKF